MSHPPIPEPVERPTASYQVETAVFRALLVLRLVLLVYALSLNLVRFEEFRRPWLAVIDLVVLVVWTAFAGWAYDAPRRRRLPLYAADLAVAVLLMLSTPLVQSDVMLDRHAATMPSFWIVGSVLAWAVGFRWPYAVGAAALLAAADLSVRTVYTGAGWGNLFLLLLVAGIVGYTTDLLRDAAEQRAMAERAAAAYAERARLSRAVHDGVLQVLALVQRRGLEATRVEGGAGGGLEGGPGGSGERDPAWADLGRLAAEQEVALRRLVQLHARGTDGSGSGTAAEPADLAGAPASTDLMALLTGLQSGTVTVSGPPQPVPLPQAEAAEVAAAVRACLDNVRRHVGTDAPAWVLVEDTGTEVVVSVRDDGPGIAAGRLEEAEDEGRLGVCGSIRGRLTDLGGRAELSTGPGRGTEWELVLPRR